MGRYRDETGFELFDWNPMTGATYWEAIVDGRRIVRTDYVADQIIAGNRAAQAEFAGRKWSEGVGDPVASVPMNVYFDQVFPLVQQQDHKAVSRWLNDSDHAAWRMRGGRV